MTTTTEYHEGDLIRVTDNKTGEGFQARARKARGPNPSDTLFLSRTWSSDWLDWTFLEWWTRRPSEYTVELVERAPEPAREKGWYKEPDATLWYWDGENWRDDDTEDAYAYESEPMIGELERLYTKGEILSRVRGTAYQIDPTYVYGGQLQQLTMMLAGDL